MTELVAGCVLRMNDGDLAGYRIAIVISSLGAGGAERVIAELSRHWCAAGALVTVIAFDSPADPIYHGFDQRVRIRRLAIASGAAGVLHRIKSLRALLRRDRPHVVVGFLTKINAITLAAMIGTGIPVIAAERNNPERQQAHVLWRIALDGLYLRAAAIVCQTAASLRCIPRYARRRSVIIPNPIVAPVLEPKPADPKRLVAVGRLVFQKGFDLLIEAFALVAARHADWQLEIWGEGPERAMLQARIEELGLEGQVTLCGLSSSAGSWISNASAFVLPSRFEGFPNVLGEAMAVGLPVVAADCDFGPSDLVTDDESGLLVAPNDVEALAAGIDRLLGDGDLRMRLGQAAAYAVTRFEPARVAALWDQMLLRVIRSGSCEPVASSPANPALRTLRTRV